MHKSLFKRLTGTITGTLSGSALSSALYFSGYENAISYAPQAIAVCAGAGLATDFFMTLCQFLEGRKCP